MNDDPISRRDFLKLCGISLLGVMLPEFPLNEVHETGTPIQGRVQATSLVVRDAPKFSGSKVFSVQRDNLLDLTELVFGGEEGDYNRLWYRLGNQGYVYSGWVQPVKTQLNPVGQPRSQMSGVLGEITVPYADSMWAINRNPTPGPRLYYGSTHWIKGLVVDQRDDSLWYKAYDNLYNSHYYTRPEWMHILSPEEFSPISPQVPDEEKQIEILLDRQLLIAYEWHVPVYAARVATGKVNFESPSGWFHTFHKRPTYHMTGGADDASVFDLPGVPWDLLYNRERGCHSWHLLA